MADLDRRRRASTLFPFLLMPVYVIFISRIALAWSLDRQVPEWFGTVSERLRAPANAIVATLAVAVVFLCSVGLLDPQVDRPRVGLAPSADPALDGKLNLVASAWFTILASSLSWIMPGINAVLAKRHRPDLVKDAPWIRWLPLIGIVWLIFALILYWFAGVRRSSTPCHGLRASLGLPEHVGVTFVGIVFVSGS